MSVTHLNTRNDSIAIWDKVDFLRQPESYPTRPKHIEIKETHMSWVFLTENLVYKLKKPVHYEFLDFSTIDARRLNCEREVQLNRRLAEDVYLGTVELCAQADGRLSLSSEGRVIDWLVKMRRLPSERMLDELILNGNVTSRDISRLCQVLIDFYRKIALQVAMAPDVLRTRFERDVLSNHLELSKPEFTLPVSQLKQLKTAQQRFLLNQGHLVERRALEGRIVEAHGDLRPEHICLLPEPVIIDCLEFNRELRLLDPLDELSFLALECERLGAPAIGTEILQYYTATTGDEAPPELIEFYKVYWACLRAKIALWHIEDHEVRDHDKWRKRARKYLDLAMLHADTIG